MGIKVKNKKKKIKAHNKLGMYKVFVSDINKLKSLHRKHKKSNDYQDIRTLLQYHKKGKNDDTGQIMF